MSTISTAARLACYDIYSPITKTVFSNIFTSGDTVCGTALVGGVFYIVLQGTETEAGWIADFDISTVTHPILGELHRGFYDNLQNIVKDLLLVIPLTRPVVVTGHSKGAGEAAILSALLKLDGVRIVQNILFACPRPGFSTLSDWLGKNIPGVSFRNVCKLFPTIGDPVPLVPVCPYEDPYAHTVFCEYPEGILKKLNPFRYHDPSLYLRYFSFITK